MRQFIIFALVLTVAALPQILPARNFIMAHAGKLFDGDKEFRFLSFNIPNLLEIEDDVGFTNGNPWRLPDQFEIDDAFAAINQMGGTVARSYVITCLRTNDLPGTPRHVLGIGQFNESVFRELDGVLAAAGRADLRLIIPLVDNWTWQGGRADYARWRGKMADEFWTDPQLISDFEQTIKFLLLRTNTVTGVCYRDDPTVLCWETGNELASPPAWTEQIAHFIKSLDTNHLVMDGFNASRLRDESLALPDVDIVTTHHYPDSLNTSFYELIRNNAAKAHGRKPYVVGEFGFVTTSEMTAAMEAIIQSGSSGGLLWSLRFRNRDGGFYWHSEPSGGNLYKAFHWPGSELGAAYDEKNLLKVLREKAFAIRGLATPKIPIPEPPKLLPISDAAAISWQGSAGAEDYVVERARANFGPWQIIASNIDEAFTQYRPQFADESVPAGNWFYRVRAQNTSGSSHPSNVEAALVRNNILVDELADFSKTYARTRGWKLTNRSCRAAKEDAHRAAGETGDELVYKLPSGITGVRVFALFPHNESDIKVSLSADASTFQEVALGKNDYPPGANDYGYWKCILYHSEGIHGATFLKIQITGETQIGRVEISHIAK